jgi:aspartate racemase
MKTIGMVGGTGWVSTAEYYRLINQITNEKLGGLEAAKIILYSVNYAEIDKINRTGKPEDVYKIIVSAARAVEKAGADCLMLCANTIHQFAPQIQNDVNLPLIHIGEETAKVIVSNKMKKVGLLGTKYTMEMDFYRSKLNEQGITAITPDKIERIFIHDIIMNELLINVFNSESKKLFLEIIDQLKNQGSEGIILGCTEIPLLIKQKDTSLPLFNTTEIHARAAVEFALG